MRRLVLLGLILMVAAACGGRGALTATALPFVEPASSVPVPALPEAGGTLPPLPTLDLPTVGPTAVLTVIQVQVTDGGEASVQGSLPPGAAARYGLAGRPGQVLTVDLSLSEGRASLSVTGEDGTMVPATEQRATHWQGLLPAGGQVIIDVRAAGGTTGASYTLKVALAAGP